ncbi:hypothetical protein F4824DRAFT_9382 [Ustulina deusta]|nr:hypothetical protein F4824DRAFT_9382 [Ustulina deusta]
MARLANLGTSVTAQGLLLGMWLDCRIRCSRSLFNENHYLIPTRTPRIAAFPPAPLRALPHPNNNRGGHNPNLWPTSIRPVLVESWFPLSSNIISAPHRQQPFAKMRAKWRKKRVRRLKRKRRKMRAPSKQLASTRSQPSSMQRTKHHDNKNKTNPPPRVWHSDKGRSKSRTVGQSPSSGILELFAARVLGRIYLPCLRGPWSEHGRDDSRRSLLGS